MLVCRRGPCTFHSINPVKPTLRMTADEGIMGHRCETLPRLALKVGGVLILRHNRRAPLLLRPDRGRL